MATRTGIMLPYWWDENRFQKKYPRPCIVQPKINGDRCRAVCEIASFDDGVNIKSYKLLSSSESEISSCMHVQKTLTESGSEFEFDGELYHHGWPQEMISGLCRTKTHVPPAAKDLEYWIFDIINEDPQLARLELLDSLYLFPLIKVEWFLINTLDEMEEKYYEFCSQGFEGIIIRHPYEPYHRKKTTTMMKLKPQQIGYYQTLGCQQEVALDGTLKPMAGSLLLQTQDGNKFNAGGMTQKDKIKIWQERDSLTGRIARIKYQNLSADRGVPLMPSFKGFLSESEIRKMLKEE